MAILKAGTQVSLVQPVITGQVAKAEIVDDDIKYLVAYTDANGESQERWFSESELEVTA